MECKQVITGNITGIYDMSGGTAEFIAAYVDNVNVSGGASIINAPSKYKDVYLLEAVIYHN